MNRIAWIFAGLLSLAVHAALFSVLSISTAPDPVQKQPLPESRINVQSYEVTRSEARKSAADPEAVQALKAGGARLSQGEVAQSRAQSLDFQAETTPAQKPLATVVRTEAAAMQRLQGQTTKPALLAARPPDSAPLTALSGRATELAQSALDQLQAESTVLSAQQAEAVGLDMPSAQLITDAASEISSLAPDLHPAQAAIAPLQTLAEAPATAPIVFASLVQMAPLAQVVPAALTVAADAPNNARLPSFVPARTAVEASSPNQVFVEQRKPASEILAQGQAKFAALPSAPLPAEKATAALAFSSDISGEVDPVSLAAIQSFMQPGDLQTSASAAGTVRDGISAVLSQIPCARLQVSFVPETGTLELNGHIPEGSLRDPVLAALRIQIGTDIRLSDNLLILPRPQCGALTGIAAVGLAQSTDQITNPRLIGENTQVAEFHFVAGDPLSLELVTPDYESYIYFDYFDADGQVIHLSPNDRIALAAYPPMQDFKIGGPEADAPLLEVRIGPPYGQEIAVAFAASVPLYEGLRPLVEPTEPYLAWIKSRVSKARVAHPDFKGEWVYFFVSTSER